MQVFGAIKARSSGVRSVTYLFRHTLDGVQGRLRSHAGPTLCASLGHVNNMRISTSLELDDWQAILPLHVLVLGIGLQLLHREISGGPLHQKLGSHGQRVAARSAGIASLSLFKSVSAHLLVKSCLINSPEAYVEAEERSLGRNEPLRLLRRLPLAHVHVLDLLHDIILLVPPARQVVLLKRLFRFFKLAALLRFHLCFSCDDENLN